MSHALVNLLQFDDMNLFCVMCLLPLAKHVTSCYPIGDIGYQFLSPRLSLGNIKAGVCNPGPGEPQVLLVVFTLKSAPNTNLSNQVKQVNCVSNCLID